MTVIVFPLMRLCAMIWLVRSVAVRRIHGSFVFVQSQFHRRLLVGLRPFDVRSKAHTFVNPRKSFNGLFQIFHTKFQFYFEFFSNFLVSGTIGWIPAAQCQIWIMINSLTFGQLYLHLFYWSFSVNFVMLKTLCEWIERFWSVAVISRCPYSSSQVYAKRSSTSVFDHAGSLERKSLGMEMKGDLLLLWFELNMKTFASNIFSSFSCFIAPSRNQQYFLWSAAALFGLSASVGKWSVLKWNVECRYCS